MKGTKYIIVILILMNLILGIYLGFRANTYNEKMKLLTEDDNKYIEKILELKKQQNSIAKQINNQNNNLNNINKQIEEKNKILNGTAKYIMKINLSQSHFSLDLSTHLKDALNDIDIYIEVSEDFYNKYNVGDIIADDFRVGSFLFKGSFGNWKVKVAEKQII